MTTPRKSVRRGRLALLAVLVAMSSPLFVPRGASAATPGPDVRLSGTVVESVAEAPSGAESTALALTTADHTYELTGVAASTLAPFVGLRVAITAGPLPRPFEVDHARVDVVGGRAAVTTTTAAATGGRNVLLVTAFWQGQTTLLDVYGRPVTAASVRQELDRTRQFFLRASGGQVDLDPVVVDEPIVTTVAAAGCPGYAMADEVERQLRSRGIDPDAYGHLMIMLPWSVDCPAGWALSPGRVSWYNAMVELNGFAHELGHNFGMPHGREATCTAVDGRPVSLSASCTTEVARVGEDMMSSGPWTPFGYHREIAGWTRSVEVGQDGTYLLAPLGTGGAAAELLRVPRADGSFLYLDVRRPGTAADGSLPVDPPRGQWTDGIAVRLVPLTFGERSASLLDTTPGSEAGFADATLLPGLTFADAASGIALRNDGPDAAGNVRVALVRSGAWAAPGAVGVARTGISTLRLTPPSSSAGEVLVDHYELGEAPDATTAPSAPSGTPVFGTVVPVRFGADGARWISVRAVGPAGMTGPWSAPLRMVADSTPPTRPAAVRATSGAGGCTVTWNAATDAISGVVRYEVRTGGSVAGTTSSAARSLTVRPHGAGGGSWVFEVVAVDAAGNRSAAAATMCVDRVVPTAPGALTASWLTGGSVRLHWAPSVDRLGTVRYYEVRQRGNTLGAAWATATTVTVRVRSQPDPTFRIEVVAVDSAGNPSRPAVATLSDTRPPAAPAVRLVWDSGGRLQARWTEPKDAGAGADYYLVRYEGGGLPAPRCCDHTLTAAWARRASVLKVASYGRRLVSVAAVDRGGNLSAWTSVPVGRATPAT